MNKTAFRTILERPRPLLLDGGLATQLEAQGCDINNPLWSASLLRTDPDEIVAASRAYLDVGAECISTASYQASRRGFEALGLSAEESDRLMLLSVDLANRARADFLTENGNCEITPIVAASIGPYGAVLHDGSEYTGDYSVDETALRRFHVERLRLFADSGADVLALETIPSKAEARTLAELLRDCSTPAWVSFSCRDGECTSDGTPIEDVASLFIDHPSVLAVGINCTPPQYAISLIERIRRVLGDTAIIAYPNSGEHYNAADGSWSGTVSPLDCGVAAGDWIDAGAHVVGGCCRMGPAHIRAMAERIEEKFE